MQKRLKSKHVKLRKSHKVFFARIYFNHFKLRSISAENYGFPEGNFIQECEQTFLQMFRFLPIFGRIFQFLVISERAHLELMPFGKNSS